MGIHDSAASSDNFPTIADARWGDRQVQTTDARELHAFLKVDTKFADWIKDRIEQFGFAEGVDFVSFDDLSVPISGSSKARRQRTKEYAITLDMGKELGMVERNEQGRKVRRYYIQCEAKARQGITADDLLGNPKQLLAIAQGYALQIEDMKRDMSVMQSDVAVLDRMGRAEDTFIVRVAASMLGMPERKFIRWLEENKWAYRPNGSKRLMGYADKRKAGYLKHRPYEYRKDDGETGVRETLVFYMAGLIRLAKILNVTIQAPQADLLGQEPR